MAKEPKPDDLVTVEVNFSTTVNFHEEVVMRRDTFDRLTQEIEDDEEVDLTEWINWDEPSDVSPSDVLDFEIIPETE